MTTATNTNSTAIHFTSIPTSIVMSAEQAAWVINKLSGTAAAEAAEARLCEIIANLEETCDLEELEALTEILDGITCLPA